MDKLMDAIRNMFGGKKSDAIVPDQSTEDNAPQFNELVEKEREEQTATPTQS